MKVVVIGLGSMGKRRIRLLLRHCRSVISVCGVDARTDRRTDAGETYGIPAYAQLHEAVAAESPAAALICTSPAAHAALTKECLEHGLHVFSELNLLSENNDSIIALAEKRGLHLFLSSTLLYRNETAYISQEVAACGTPVHYRYHVGQYLPDWHPWESYKDFFVADRKTNGCRELFAIELPWLLRTFGAVVRFHCVRDTISALELDYPDSYIVLLEHEHGHTGTLHVDVVSRKAVRQFEAYADKLHIRWEGTPQSLTAFNPQSGAMEQIETYAEVERDSRYADNIIENAYLEELTAFIAEIEGRGPMAKYTFRDDAVTLALIDRIEGLAP